MSQQTRKDPRAKVLSMTVRYKSATLDEFIEHHSHDISRGGMFIKTQQPFPPGTLLKFEVRLAEDQKVMQGVGRVVWKRDGDSGDPERPAGMGIKYIKLDDESRRLIDQLLASRIDATSAFDSEAAADVVGEAQVGLGLAGLASLSERPEQSTTSFFPKSDPSVMPAPEDRTVMKQASELLEEALREVGADSTDGGVDRSPAGKQSKPQSLAPAADEIEETKPGRPGVRGDDGSLARLPTPKPPEIGAGPSRRPEQFASDVVASAKAAQSSGSQPRSIKPSSERQSSGQPTRSSEPSSHALPTRPSAPKPLRDDGRRAAQSKPAPAVPSAPPKAESGSSGRGLYWLLAVAASVGAIYWFTRPSDSPQSAREIVASEAKVGAPIAVAPPSETNNAVASVAAAAPPVVAAAASPSASASATPSPEPSVPAVSEPVAAPVTAKPVVSRATVRRSAAASLDTEPTAAAEPAQREGAAEEAKPTEAKAEEVKPTEAKAEEAKPTEAKTEEAKPTEAKSQQESSGANKPAESKPVDKQPESSAAPKDETPKKDAVAPPSSGDPS